MIRGIALVFGLITLDLVTAVPASAEPTAAGSSADAPTRLTSRLHADYSHFFLDNDTPNWSDFNVRGYFESEASTRWIVEAAVKNHFGESGFVLGATLSQDYTPDWYQIFSAVVGTNARILPSTNFFTQLNRRLGPSRNWVFGVGIGRASYFSGFSDLYGTSEVLFYASPSLIFQAGIRFNRSQPGSVNSSRGSLAATIRLRTELELIYRVDFGSEGYAVVGAGNLVTKYQSTLHNLMVRWWLSPVWLELGTELYYSPRFNRRGGIIGLSYDF